MRGKMDHTFYDYFLRIKNRQERESIQQTSRNSRFFNYFLQIERESLKKIFATTYSNLDSFYSNSSCTDFLVILITKNDFVDEINTMLIDRFTGRSKKFIGTNEAIEFNNQIQLEDTHFKSSGLPH